MNRETLEERIISAIEILWASVLEIRNFSSKFTFFQSILLPNEYNEVIPKELGKIVVYISREDFDNQSNTLVSGIETVRPFVGESIWALYTIYRAFAIRQALKVQDGLQKKKLYEWDKDFQGQPDTALRQLLTIVFSDDELLRIISEDHLGATARIISAIEFKLLNEINEWVFNRKYRPVDLDQQLKVQTLTAVLGNMNVNGDVIGRDKIIVD